jgi:hypothetical protein
MWEYFVTIWNWFIQFIESIWVSVITYINNFFYNLFDGALWFIEELVTTIPVPVCWSSVSNPLATLPGVSLHIFSQIGIMQVLCIIGTAYGIRFLLNLIPGAFTRI